MACDVVRCRRLHRNFIGKQKQTNAPFCLQEDLDLQQQLTASKARSVWTGLALQLAPKPPRWLNGRAVGRSGWLPPNEQSRFGFGRVAVVSSFQTVLCTVRYKYNRLSDD